MEVITNWAAEAWKGNTLAQRGSAIFQPGLGALGVYSLPPTLYYSQHEQTKEECVNV
jgi:hypothetical protein